MGTSKSQIKSTKLQYQIKGRFLQIYPSWVVGAGLLEDTEFKIIFQEMIECHIKQLTILQRFPVEDKLLHNISHINFRFLIKIKMYLQQTTSLQVLSFFQMPVLQVLEIEVKGIIKSISSFCKMRFDSLTKILIYEQDSLSLSGISITKVQDKTKKNTKCHKQLLDLSKIGRIKMLNTKFGSENKEKPCQTRGKVSLGGMNKFYLAKLQIQKLGNYKRVISRSEKKEDWHGPCKVLNKLTEKFQNQIQLIQLGYIN